MGSGATVHQELGVRVNDGRLTELLDTLASVERFSGGTTWCEDPLWLLGDDSATWSRICGDRILRWTAATGQITVDCRGVEFLNGRSLVLGGRVDAYSQGRWAIECTEADGDTSVLVGHYGSARQNSPNDVVGTSDGAIWLTDPVFSIVQPHEGHPGTSEYGGNHWGVVYDVMNGRLFAEINPGLADALRVDVEGDAWTSNADSGQVFAPNVVRRGQVPETVANLCFGSADRDVLYIAATTSLDRRQASTRGR